MMSNESRQQAMGDEAWQLRLFLAGSSAEDNQALEKLKRICEEYLPGGSSIEVVDVEASPELANSFGIIALPTLVREKPEPERRVVGDLTLTQAVLSGLGLSRRVETDSGR